MLDILITRLKEWTIDFKKNIQLNSVDTFLQHLQNSTESGNEGKAQSYHPWSTGNNCTMGKNQSLVF